MRTAVTAALAAVLVLASVAPVAAGTDAPAVEGGVTAQGGGNATAQGTPPCAGVVSNPAGGTTVVSVQGARLSRNGSKTAARLVAFGPRGSIEWVKASGRENGITWSYDVDPLGNGNLFVTATKPGSTRLYELNTTTGERVWTERLPFHDTHDADPLNRTHVVVANMRNPDPANGSNGDRVVIHDRVDDEIVWEWRFDDHFDPSVGGNYSDDWTHLNDVDRVNGSFLLSPRNFDQVLLVNRTTDDIEMRLGADGDHDVLYEQHNPDFLRGDGGTPTVLVADSENDRIVEYARQGAGEWTQTWRVGSEGTLSWPRDADRLRNGHTLISDSINNRVLEVTPRGTVVWEAYAPWLVYDAERIPAGGFDSDAYADLGGSRGPSMRGIGGAGSYDLTNASPPSRAALEACAAAITAYDTDWGANTTAGATDGNGTPSATATRVPETIATTETGAPGVGALAALCALGLALAAVGRRGS